MLLDPIEIESLQPSTEITMNGTRIVQFIICLDGGTVHA